MERQERLAPDMLPAARKLREALESHPDSRGRVFVKSMVRLKPSGPVGDWLWIKSKETLVIITVRSNNRLQKIVVQARQNEALLKFIRDGDWFAAPSPPRP